MTTDNRTRLGRGLASLIGDTAGYVERPETTGALAPNLPVSHDEAHRLVPLEMISPSPLNPRKSFSPTELDELASSIRQRGVVQPLIVRPNPSGHGYELVAGERRWRAAQQAGVYQVPVLVRELGDQEVLELALIENVQRTDLNAIEEAFGYRDLIERFSYNQEDLAKIIGKSRSHLTNTLRLLKLPETVQALVREGAISAGHARALIGHPNAEAIARRVATEGLSVRQVEALVQAEARKDAAAVTIVDDHPMEVGHDDEETAVLQQEMAEVLGILVDIKKGKGQTGEIRLKYQTLDQFDDIYLRLTGKYMT